MKRLDIQTPNANNFIGSWNLNDDQLCKNIINFFENNSQLQKKGATALGVNEDIKKTTDITIDPIQLKNNNYSVFNDYFQK